MAVYFFKMNGCFWHVALFLWQAQHFVSIGCLSNTVAMVTFTRFLRKIIENSIDMISYYASRMNYPSLKYTQNFWFLTLFKCVLLSFEPNVVRSLLSAGGPFTVVCFRGCFKAFWVFELRTVVYDLILQVKWELFACVIFLFCPNVLRSQFMVVRGYKEYCLHLLDTFIIIDHSLGEFH